MKILIIERDQQTAEMIKNCAEHLGHTAEIHNEMIENLGSTASSQWDMVFLDPFPPTHLTSMMMQLKQNVRRNLHVVLVSNRMTHSQAIQSGFNDCIIKPLQDHDIIHVLENAEYMSNYTKHLANTEIDFPSASGIISKSAYNQIFLSCLNRAGRYGETSYTIIFTVENYNEILAEYGEYDAQMIAGRMIQYIMQIRRQSDIIAQIRPNQYALLLLRPLNEIEPIEATRRFTNALPKCKDFPKLPNLTVDMSVTLLALPMGSRIIDEYISLRPEEF
ncbi:MAG: response regulator [Alphaproteobacteria bacterium]|nr:response regulator [Alphaproteobacteria bacterium]